MRSARDEAVVLATSMFRKLFERVWFPWSPTLERAVARLVDLIIEAAVEQLRNERDEAFLKDLIDEEPAYNRRRGAYTGETIREGPATEPLLEGAPSTYDEQRQWRSEAEQRGARDLARFMQERRTAH